MITRRILRVTAGLVALAACSLSPASVTFLPVADEEILPLFLFSTLPTFGSYQGHGFLLDRGAGRQPLGMTVHHVAGSTGTGSVDPANPQASALLNTVLEGRTPVRLGERIPIPGAATINSTDSQRDVAAFKVMDWDATRALTLAATAPALGDTVYVLAAHVGDRPDGGPRRHPALVTSSTDNSLRYRYLASANANMTSGAAVLNKSGQVVGLNAGTIGQGAEVTGIAVTLTSLRGILDAIP